MQQSDGSAARISVGVQGRHQILPLFKAANPSHQKQHCHRPAGGANRPISSGPQSRGLRHHPGCRHRVAALRRGSKENPPIFMIRRTPMDAGFAHRRMVKWATELSEAG